MIILGIDKTNKKEIDNVVYKIYCNDCEATYIGITSRPLKWWQYEHQYCVQKKDERPPLTIHNLKIGHDFDYEGMKIIDREKLIYSRKFSKMLHIHYYDNTINRTEDTNFLKNDYKNAIDTLKTDNKNTLK